MATQHPPAGKPPEGAGKSPTSETGTAQDVELLKVEVTRSGQKVNAQWAIHPQIKHDLSPEEWKEVSDLMAKVAGIVGHRFAQVLGEAEPDQPGSA
ncbi:MAG: hypothetical protein FJ246_05245 [Nitrospira sp.]|nr:hypothetical protein [Nitrospira sp.]